MSQAPWTLFWPHQRVDPTRHLADLAAEHGQVGQGFDVVDAIGVLPHVQDVEDRGDRAQSQQPQDADHHRWRHAQPPYLYCRDRDGVIAKFGSMVSEQYALMIATLLSPWGGVKISHSDIVKLPTYFAERIIPVMHDMPPYDYFAIKPKVGRIPIHRADAEIGLPAGCDQVTTLSAEECWRRLIPFAALSAAGLFYLCNGW